MTSIGSLAARAGHLALDALLPARCLKCGATVRAPGALCGECWAGLAFLTAPYCACCGFPFEFDAGPGALCATCTRARPTFNRARAALKYDDASRGLIIDFKHGDRTDAAPAFIPWMRQAGAELLAEADAIVPVPLHWLRLFARRYNQAAMLAAGLAKAAGRPAIMDGLIRRRRTPSQGRLGPSARRRNVAGAFAVPARRQAAFEGRRVLLVDDVLTTGATAEACAAALLRAGAAGVDVLTLARVVRPQAE